MRARERVMLEVRVLRMIVWGVHRHQELVEASSGVERWLHPGTAVTFFPRGGETWLRGAGAGPVRIVFLSYLLLLDVHASARENRHRQRGSIAC